MLTEVTLRQEITEYMPHMTSSVSQVLACLSLGALTWGDEGTRKDRHVDTEKMGLGGLDSQMEKPPTPLKLPVFIVHS